MALVLTTAFFTFYAFTIVLTVCELGQRMTNECEDIDDEIEAFEWNLFSLEIQKMLLIILLEVQQPVELLIFGSTYGLRETFTKVCLNYSFYTLSGLKKSLNLIFNFQVVNRAYSYFSVIRQFLR